MADQNRSDSNVRDTQATSSPVTDKPQAPTGQDASPPTTTPEPCFVDIDGEGYLFADDWDGGDWPTHREYKEYDWMSIEDFDGDIGELNRALAQRGANIVVCDPRDQ